MVANSLEVTVPHVGRFSTFFQDALAAISLISIVSIRSVM